MTNIRRGDENAADAPENEGETIVDGGDANGPAKTPRVRFQGVVDGEGDAIPANAYFDRPGADVDLEDGVEVVRPTEWRRLSRQLDVAARVCAIFVFVAMLTFWPVFTAVGHMRIVGSLQGWSLIAAYPPWAVIFTMVGPVMLWAFGRIVSRQMLMMDAAEKIALSAQQLTEPDRNAVFNVQSVGAAVRTQISAVNAGIDDALIRLASVEAMIRQHVEAIETAGAAIETRATGSLDQVASERAKLMKLTEQLNEQADDFAVAIAEKAQANIDSFNSVNAMTGDAEAKLEERLRRLETIADRALTSFESLGAALESSEGKFANTASVIRTSSEDVQKASDQASKIAEEAAAAAARNAVNIGQFSKRASDEATKAAEDAIETARIGAEMAADAAVEAAKSETGRIADAVIAAVETMKAGADETVEAAAQDAERTVKATEALGEAADKAAEAAKKATDTVESAGAAAKAAAEKASDMSDGTADRLEQRNKELADARAALETENTRLESLIQEQRQRADRLADAIATQTERLSRLAEVQLREQEAALRIAEAEAAKERLQQETRPANTSESADAVGESSLAEGDVTIESNAPETTATREDDADSNTDRKAGRRNAETPLTLVKSDTDDAKKDKTGNGKDTVSWREILNATDDAEPLDLGANDRGEKSDKTKAANGDGKSDGPLDAVEVVHRLQNFTLNLDRRLYGDAPKQLLERFDRGDRNLFAHRLLRLNETDVKRRIRIESGRDEAFEKAIHDFLQGFESLLEEATTSDTADEDLEEYLGSPLGRVYLLIGATVGYFA